MFVGRRDNLLKLKESIKRNLLQQIASSHETGFAMTNIISFTLLCMSLPKHLTNFT